MPTNRKHENALLASLPHDERLIILKQLKAVPIPAKTVLYQPDRLPSFVYFITQGVASMMNHMQDGKMTEVNLVGSEGFAESFHLMGSIPLQTTCLMLIEGSGLRMKFKDFEQIFRQMAPLREAVLRFIQYQSILLSQLAACNQLHDVQTRVARWLLMMADRVEACELQLTHELVANALGCRRSTVSAASELFREQGLIKSVRGTIHIVDRDGLARTTCECYQITRNALERLRQPIIC